MKGYVVCVYKSINDEDKLKNYAVKARVAVEKYKGKYIVKDLDFYQNVDVIRCHVSESYNTNF